MDNIFNALIALCAAVITCFVIPWVRANTKATDQANITMVVQMAVAAAEQLFGSGHGAEKLDYVVKYLADLKIKVSREEIEAAVFWLSDAITGGLVVQDE